MKLTCLGFRKDILSREKVWVLEWIYDLSSVKDDILASDMSRWMDKGTIS